MEVEGKDQIQDLLDLGFLVNRGGAHDPDRTHRWYGLEDTTSPGSTLEKRARSYLASNCSHCHRPGGSAEWTLAGFPDYRYFNPNAAMNYLARASFGSWGTEVPPGDTARWVYPGRPDYSTLFRRISAAHSQGYRDQSRWLPPGSRPAPTQALAKRSGWPGNGLIQMPPIATYEVNPEANRVIHAWIRSLPPGHTGPGTGTAKGAKPISGGALGWKNGLIHLPGSPAPGDGGSASEVLLDVRGRSWPLISPMESAGERLK